MLANQVAELKAAQHPVMDDEDFGAGEIEADREDYEYIEAVEGAPLTENGEQPAEPQGMEGVVE